MVDDVISASGGWEGDPGSSYLPGRVLEEDGITADMMAKKCGKLGMLLLIIWLVKAREGNSTCKSNVISRTPNFHIGKVTRVAMVEFQPVITDCSSCL
eukprot:4427652-Ditylum_brightwellii.AAC.1